MPANIAQFSRVNDPYVREARTILDAVKARTPWSTDLFPRRDIWGEPIIREGSAGPDYVSPIYERRMNNDPVNLAMVRLKIFPARLDREIRDVKLTDQQYDDYARIAGRNAKMRLDAIVKTPGFNSAPPGVQHDLIKQAVDSAREQARALIMMQNPQIVRDAMQNKVTFKTTGVKPHAP